MCYKNRTKQRNTDCLEECRISNVNPADRRTFSYYLAHQTLPSVKRDQSINTVRKINVVYSEDHMTQYTPWASAVFWGGRGGGNAEAGRACSYHCVLRGSLTQPFLI